MLTYSETTRKTRYDTLSGLAFASFVLMGVFFNQSRIMFGFNISLSDFFLIPVFSYFLFSGRLRIRLSYFSFFFTVSFFGFMSAVFFIPGVTPFSPSLNVVLAGYIKLLASFLYFLVGFSVFEKGWSEVIVRSYSIGAFLIGFLGLLVTVSGTGFLRAQLLYGNFRLRGLMNDPNYFSVIQVTALVFFLRLRGMRKIVRFLVSLILVISIIASGSKTGLLTLAIYSVLFMFEQVSRTRRRVFLLAVICLAMLLALLAYALLADTLPDILDSLSRIIPAFSRVKLLFTDFSSALVEGGSGRNTAWYVATNIIQLSPVFGIGFGTYSEVSNTLFGTRMIAHNTFFQILAEWGIPLAVCFFVFVMFLIVKASLNMRENDYLAVIARDIVIVLLIGSMGISLNNARMFWFFLGLLSISIQKGELYLKKRKRQGAF